MSDQIGLDAIRSTIVDFFTETFEQVNGIYLDRGTSLFETLGTISAEEASRPVSATCASLAAQVEHVRFYIDTLEVYMKGGDPGKVDWGEVWRRVSVVTPDEWDESRGRLRESYERVTALMNSFTKWEDEMDNALAVVVHTAYHLGEIRQALCTLKPPAG